MASLCTFHCLLLLLLSSLFLVCKSENCHPQDKKVLLTMKKEWNSPYNMISWTPDTDCCDWAGVRCHEINYWVTDLNLQYFNFSGQIPASVAGLQHLESLTIRKFENLTGTIPQSITKLTKLTSLTVSWTNISGPIPSFLGELKNLDFLDLSFNNLSGSIPASFSQLQKLTGLRLDRNKLSGSIPESLSNLPPGLQYVYLSHNQLSGQIPRGWGNAKFLILEVQRNMFEGDVSFLLGKNKVLQWGFFSRNKLSFDFSKVELSKSLFILEMEHNKIYGSLPESMTKLQSLYRFNVSYNQLCGKIPTAPWIQRLDASNFVHNKCLCGPPLPACK